MPAQAGIVLTDVTNITLAASQVESGGDTSENPDVTGGSAGASLAYTATGSFLNGTHAGLNLDDGDVGAGNPSDGTYAVSNSATDLILDLGAAYNLTSIAIYNGYTNRDDGTYTLLDDDSNVLGAWTISTTSGGTNDGADSFWISFDTPVATHSLTLVTASTDCCGTDSYREIVVFGSAVAPLHLTVDSTAADDDANPGDGVCASSSAECTLPAAIQEANAWPAADQIDVPAGVYPPITLSITDDLTIQGAGSSCDTGTKIRSVFVDWEVEAEISQVCVSSAAYSNDCGSSIHLSPLSTLHLRSVEVIATGYDPNPTLYSGIAVGIDNEYGRLIFDAGAIRGYMARCLGGPFHVAMHAGTGLINRGIATLQGVEITANGTTEPLGGSNESTGGVENSGSLQIVNSYVADNHAVDTYLGPVGAGISNYLGTTLASNVSLSGYASPEGLVFNGMGGYLGLSNVTLSSSSGYSTAIANDDVSGAVTEIQNTIVTTDGASACSGTMTSLGHNVEKETSCGFSAAGDQQNVAISLSSDTSGPTTTLVPTSGTNIEDLGDNVGCPHLDQRGHFRPENGTCDIGAAEISSAVACANGRDDDGDGLIDALDPGCADASDPQELELAAGDVLTGDSDASLTRLDPATGDVRILTRGLGLRGPFGVAADEGRVFVSDGSMVFQIDPQTGVPALIAGLSPGGLSHLEFPRGLSLDANGLLLVGDTDQDVVVRINPSGAQAVVSAAAPFLGPEYAAEDPGDGSLLVSDFGNSTPQGIYRIDPSDGSVIESWTGAPFADPRQHVLDPDGTSLWVADSGASALFKLDLGAPMGGGNPLLVGTGLGEAWGVVLDPNGVDAIVAARSGGTLWRVPLDGSAATIINDTDVVRPHHVALVPLPEPSGLWMLGCGAACLLALGRATRRTRADE